MGKFDTHGGYFAPDNYIRVNEGGSHDENPNGGVQMGVDSQGVPNMVEEDETVYDDYVFSDNITVDKEMQEKHLLPRWAVGKLYSAVVDRLVTEAEERGNDPISNKGLEAMLGRCRDAQEEQKALQEQRELEDELSQLSPEELDQLEAMLAQQGQAPQGEMMPQEQMIPEEQMMGPAEPMPQEAMPMPGQEQVPMMANGGFIRTFEDGGDVPPSIPFVNAEGRSTGYLMPGYDNGQELDLLGGQIDPAVSIAYPGKTQAWVDAQISPFRRGVTSAISNAGSDIFNTAKEVAEVLPGPIGVTTNLASIPTDIAYGQWGDAGRHLGMAIIGGGAKLARSSSEVKSLLDAADADVTKWKSELDKANSGKKALSKGGEGTADSWDEAIRQADLRYKEAKAYQSKLKSEYDAAVKVEKGSAKPAKVEKVKSEKPVETSDSPKKKSGVGKKVAGWGIGLGATGLVGAGVRWGSNVYRDIKDANNYVENVDTVDIPGLNFDFLAGYENPDTSSVIPVDTSAVVPADTTVVAPADTVNTRALGGSINRFDGLSRYSGKMQRPVINGFSPYSAFQINESVFDVPLAPEPDYGSLLEPVAPSEDDIFNAMSGYNRGSYQDFMNTVMNYLPSRTRGGVEGKYQIDRAFDPYLHGNRDVAALEHDPRFTAFTDLAVQEAAKGNRRALMYLAKLDEGVADWTKRLFDANGKLKSNFEQIYRDRRKDGLEGIYHLIPNVNSAEELAGFFDEPNLSGLVDPGAPRLVNVPQEKLSLTSSLGKPSGRNAGQDQNKMPYLSTLPRYAGALTAGALGLYNAFQRPDRYTIPHYNPVLPQGQLHLTDPVYNPLDQEQAAQSVLASNAGTNRQIMNSGSGPSIGATLLASDYNAGQNLGAARQTVWDANNQRRNAVLAGRNQNATALANFDYGQSRDRAGILNEAAVRNMQNDLIRQRLNYDAESQKYAALQSNLDSVSQALAGIGQENKVLNALNTNNALYHFLSPNGVAAYKAWDKDDDATQNAKCGGKIKRKK